ncbi:hypothetical protein [Furfurilactobacillus milii]|nr:hypothetical protein [Furfurilactobacillus milii]
MVNLHWTSQQFYDADYYELMALLGAKEKDKRIADPMDLMKAVRSEQK